MLGKRLLRVRSLFFCGKSTEDIGSGDKGFALLKYNQDVAL